MPHVAGDGLAPAKIPVDSGHVTGLFVTSENAYVEVGTGIFLSITARFGGLVQLGSGAEAQIGNPKQLRLRETHYISPRVQDLHSPSDPFPFRRSP